MYGLYVPTTRISDYHLNELYLPNFDFLGGCPCWIGFRACRRVVDDFNNNNNNKFIRNILTFISSEAAMRLQRH